MTALIIIVVAIAVWYVIASWPRIRSRTTRKSSRATMPIPDGAPQSEPGTRTFRLGVHGESYDNPDGTSRQRIIRNCRRGEPMLLLPEPDNAYDHLAVKVCRQSGEQLGYLPAGHGLTKRIKAGNVSAQIDSIVGGSKGKPSRGVVLNVTVND